MIRAAGILIVSKAGRALFLKRGPGGDMPGLWAFPGGRLEEGESTLDAAIRETVEEAGHKFKASELAEWTRRITPRETTGAAPTPPPKVEQEGDTASVPAPPEQGTAVIVPGEQVDFTTFIVQGVEEFQPTLNDEHVAFAWAPLTEPPMPVHPGCEIALKRALMTELDMARAMSLGEITSPQRFNNMSLFNLRITGTGLSYRTAIQEHVWRDPSLYLNDEFLARCNGLPVIFEHPNKKILNSKEFNDRIVGTVMLPYIKGDEVWGVARIYDDAAVKMMTDDQLSTSPAVVWRAPDVNNKLELEDGSKFLIEGKPSLLDHLAICERGVWDKGGDPTGVETVNTSTGDNDMLKRLDGETDESYKNRCDEANKLLEAARSDSQTSGASILAGINAVTAKLDSLSVRMDSFEDKIKEKKADEDDKPREAMDEDDDKEKADKEDEKDDEDDNKEKADEDEKEAKADAVVSNLQKQLDETRAALATLQTSMPKPLTDADHMVFANYQAEADAVHSIFGSSAPRPLQGETPLAYRRRLAAGLQEHSPTWKGADLGVIAADDASLAIVSRQIYSEAAATGRNPKTVAEGTLRPITRTLSSGHRVTEFVGTPQAWMQRHQPGKRFLTAINVGNNK